MTTFGNELVKATKAWKDGVSGVLKPLGVTLSAYQLLSAVYELQYEKGLPTQREAADHVGLDLNVASQTIKFLTSHHLLNKERKTGDTRAYTLSLTLAGEQLAKTANQAVGKFEKDFFASVHAEHFGEALSSLTNKTV